MGFFKRGKKEEHHTSTQKDSEKTPGGFLGFALLSLPEWDKEQFIADYKELWGVEIVEDEHDDPENEDELIYATVDGMTAMVGFMNMPVPDGEAEYWAQGNYMWKDGVDIVKTHEAQLIVSVLGDYDIIAKGKLFVKLAAAAMKQENAIAFYNEGAVFPPEMYLAFCEPLKNGGLPLLNWVWFGIFGDEKEIGCYTYGMRRLGKEEMEVYVPRESADLNNIRSFLLDIVGYVLDGDVTLRDGETIGFSAEQRLPITLSKGIAVDGNTLKIGYGE